MPGHLVATATPMHAVVAPSGDLDLDCSPALRAALRAAGDTGLPVQLDLSSVTFIDSAALGAVLSASNQLRAQGGRLLVTGASSRIATVMRLAGLSALLSAADQSEPLVPASPVRARRAN